MEFEENRIINQIKGKVMEEIAELLFRELGYRVIHYGYEHTVRELAQNINRNQKSSILELIRKQPDFIIIDEKTNEPFFLEVKYRKNGILKLKKNIEISDEFEDFLEEELFWDEKETLYLVFSKKEPYIQINNINYLEHKGLIDIEKFNWIKKNEKIIKKYKNITKKITKELF